MITLRVVKIGDNECIVLNDEARNRLGVTDGDTVLLTEAPGGACRVTRCTPELERQLKLAEQILCEDREVFKALVK